MSKKQENMSEEPEDISCGKELVRFLKDTGNPIQLSESEADMLLGYIEGHDYTLGVKDGVLYRGDLCFRQGGIFWEDEPYPIDDVIDTVCEWNYELSSEYGLSDEEEKIYRAPGFEPESPYDERIASLFDDEKVLDALFEKTRYGRQMNEVVESIAEALIEAVQKSDNIDKVVTNVAEEIRSYGSGGRSR